MLNIPNVWNENRWRAFFGKDVMTMSHEIAECVLRKVNKSWKFNSCSTHQPTFDDKSKLKVITQQHQLKRCSQKDWNCKAKFVHTSKIIKIGTLTDVRDCCLRTFLFFFLIELEVVWLRSVSRSTTLKFLDHALTQIFTSVQEKKTCFASYLSTNQSWITNFEKKFHGRSGLPYFTLTSGI